MHEFDLNWAYLYQKPEQTALLKSCPQDFVVLEDLGFEPSGVGEHVLVRIRKTNENTAWVAKLLAEFCQMPVASIGWAGLKDRNAVTEQWFSLHLPGQETPDFTAFNSDTIQVLSVTRHDKKLRPGMLSGNDFIITLRDIAQPNALESRLQKVIEQGVPNYFGEQRFGHDGNNLREADVLLAGKKVKVHHKRAIYLSAARSYLFNRLISNRIENQQFFKIMRGDFVRSMTDEASALASGLSVRKQLQQQLDDKSWCVTAPLWGAGDIGVTDEAQAWEMSVLSPWQSWLDALQQLGMQMDRRRALLKPQRLCWRWLNQHSIELQFRLVSGSYATSVLRELVQTREENVHEDSGQ